MEKLLFLSKKKEFPTLCLCCLAGERGRHEIENIWKISSGPKPENPCKIFSWWFHISYLSHTVKKLILGLFPMWAPSAFLLFTFSNNRKILHLFPKWIALHLNLRYIIEPFNPKFPEQSELWGQSCPGATFLSLNLAVVLWEMCSMALTQNQQGSLPAVSPGAHLSAGHWNASPHLLPAGPVCPEELQLPQKAGAEVLRAVGTWSCALKQPLNKPLV